MEQVVGVFEDLFPFFWFEIWKMLRFSQRKDVKKNANQLPLKWSRVFFFGEKLSAIPFQKSQYFFQSKKLFSEKKTPDTNSQNSFFKMPKSLERVVSVEEVADLVDIV
jgi:hypothetical protein